MDMGQLINLTKLIIIVTTIKAVITRTGKQTILHLSITKVITIVELNSSIKRNHLKKNSHSHI